MCKSRVNYFPIKTQLQAHRITTINKNSNQIANGIQQRTLNNKLVKPKQKLIKQWSFILIFSCFHIDTLNNFCNRKGLEFSAKRNRKQSFLRQNRACVFLF